MGKLSQPIGRVAFFIRLLITLIVFALLEPFADIESSNGHVAAINVVIFVGWLVSFVFLLLCFVRYVLVTRLASIGLSRWYAALILIPLINSFFILFLLFYPARPVSGQVPEPISR
jgi:uncharacterized membrane protein YhaH (DUF805 family)